MLGNIAIMDSGLAAMDDGMVVCRTGPGFPDTHGTDWCGTASILSCMQMVRTGHHQRVAVVFPGITLREREALIELCGCLKQGVDGGAPVETVLALLPEWNRRTAERLAAARVDYLGVYSAPDGWKDVLLAWQDGPEKSTRSAVRRLCPFLDYRRVDGRHELVTCRAYRNRLVVGRYLAGQFCHGENHKACEYYRAPLFQSPR